MNNKELQAFKELETLYKTQELSVLKQTLQRADRFLMLVEKNKIDANNKNKIEQSQKEIKTVLTYIEGLIQDNEVQTEILKLIEND